MADGPSINRGASHINNPERTIEKTGGQPETNQAGANGSPVGRFGAGRKPVVNSAATHTENRDIIRVENSDEETEIGEDARIFEEEDMVNAAMIPDLFGYRSLEQNRERIDEIESRMHEEP